MRTSIAHIAAAAIIALLAASCSNGKSSFTLVNKSSEPIARAVVTICGQTIELKEIQPNKSASAFYGPTFDSHYVIQVDFASGKRLKSEAGYVTNGMNFQDEFTVTESEITMTDSRTSSTY